MNWPGLNRRRNREAFAYVALGNFYGTVLCIGLADRSILTSVLRWRGWYIIARLSVGRYLNHMMVREPTHTNITFVTSILPAGSLLAFLLGLLVTVLGSASMAAISFVLVEYPGLALRDRWLSNSARQHSKEPRLSSS